MEKGGHGKGCSWESVFVEMGCSWNGCVRVNGVFVGRGDHGKVCSWKGLFMEMGCSWKRVFVEKGLHGNGVCGKGCSCLFKRLYKGCLWDSLGCFLWCFLGAL